MALKMLFYKDETKEQSIERAKTEGYYIKDLNKTELSLMKLGKPIII
jgi:hypothetical protein